MTQPNEQLIEAVKTKDAFERFVGSGSHSDQDVMDLYDLLQQTKEERNEWEKGYNRKMLRYMETEAEVESLRTELSAKNKVLIDVRKECAAIYSLIQRDLNKWALEKLEHVGNDIGTILSQYKGEPNEKN